MIIRIICQGEVSLLISHDVRHIVAKKSDEIDKAFCILSFMMDSPVMNRIEPI